MRSSFKWIVKVGILPLAAYVLMGADPGQTDRPPQPYFQDFFSGIVLVQGDAPPQGTKLSACIGDCTEGYRSEVYSLAAGGRFDQLEVNPVNQDLVGQPINFYLENEFGRIRAVETRPYIGVFDFYVQNLTFIDPIPTPPPTPRPSIPGPTPKPTPVAALPIAGDPLVAYIPRFVLILGLVTLLVGGVLVASTKWRKI